MRSFTRVKKMANNIKFFTSLNMNAPSLSNDWGVLIDILDACLVTGYGSQPVAGIGVENGIAIVTFNSPHGLQQFQVIELSGADQPEFNGEFKILGVGATTIEFSIEVPDQVATGTISCKVAPLGWDKKFSGTHKAVYQAKDKTLNPYFLRVDNSLDPLYTANYAKYGKVGILESCTGIDDLTGRQAPFSEDEPTRNWIATGSGSGVKNGWFKWQYAVHESSATSKNYYESEGTTNGNRPWMLIGDDSGFFIIPHATVNNFLAIPYGFCCIQHGEKSKPYLFATNRWASAGYNNLCETPLGRSELISAACLYDHNNKAANTRFSSLTPGMKSNIVDISSGVATNNIKVDPLDGHMLTPFYVLDPNNYLIGKLPMIHFCVNDASTLPDKTPFNIGNDYFISCRYRNTAGGVIGSLFVKLHEGGLL